MENKNVEERDEQKGVSQYIPYLFLFTILLFFSVFGMTYSIYKGDTGDNEIITDQIIFTYSDVEQRGNGINIIDAVPLTDTQGKMLTKSNEYFDFYITTTTNNSPVKYKVLILKDQNSTLSNDNVRLYLTKLNGSYEEEILLDNFSNLKQESINNKDYFVLYERNLSSNLSNYSDAYRLRMWVKEDAVNYFDQYFSIKVDIYAEQFEE